MTEVDMIDPISAAYEAAPLDILAALSAAPEKGRKRCKLQVILDDIPADAPGRADLIHLTELAEKKDPDFRTLDAMLMVYARMGTPIGKNVLSLHRGRVCLCYR